MLAGGGTTCVASVPTPDARDRDPPPDAVGGGGTGFVRKSPVAELPQLLRSRLTCDGGGATTAGAGSVNLGVDETSRWGAETGGATTSTACVSGTRESAKSRCSSRGAGATMAGASGLAVRILSRETFGAGGTIVVLRVGEVRVGVLETSGVGGMTLLASALERRVVVWEEDEFNSGEGGTAVVVIAGSIGAMRDERRPSAGGGPGFGL
jgi:hypothetical protein